ncbi:MAG: DNA topoisomerase IB [Chitinophagaceae bacterium]
MPAQEEVIIDLPKRKIGNIIKDAVKCAEAVNLVYVSNTEPGIQRLKKGNAFEYFYQNKKVRDKATLQRIKGLVLPPAWEDVWVCAVGNGHLQATGIDTKKRKQYRYHPLWNSLRNHTKFYRLNEFGKVLPAIRFHLEKDITLPDLPLDKVLATVVRLMERTNIRVGNCFYKKLYGSFGLTTFKDKHVAIDGQNIRFSFKGKKGVCHDISIRSKRLANIVKKCRDIAGKELFQYINEKGEKRTIDSGMVNEYIRKISGGDFTAKDFRTWAGTVQALMAFKNMALSESETQSKKNIVAALDAVSKLLGNTRTVCKKYYVHPVIISLYEKKSLELYTKELDSIEDDNNKTDLTKDEKVLMKIFESN